MRPLIQLRHSLPARRSPKLSGRHRSWTWGRAPVVSQGVSIDVQGEKSLDLRHPECNNREFNRNERLVRSHSKRSSPPFTGEWRELHLNIELSCFAILLVLELPRGVSVANSLSEMMSWKAARTLHTLSLYYPSLCMPNRLLE